MEKIVTVLDKAISDLQKLRLACVSVSDNDISEMLPLRPTDGSDATEAFNTATMQARGGARMLRDKILTQ